MKLALVLGAGGLVGVAHHVGVLKALEEETGVGEPSADLVVGTSAGSAVGAYLRSGWTATELIERATDLRSAAPSPSSSGVLDAVRHGIGSAYIVARTSVRIPSPLSLPPLGALRRAFPAGLVTMGEGGSMLERELPRSWPERRLWLGTYDLVAHRRVVLGRPGEPYVSLPAAVKASCAIPGVYPPVRAGGAVLVDGGAWSLTNADLAAVGGCRAVVCIAPMAFDPGSPPGPTQRLVRELSTRSLFRTVARLKRQGVRVVVLAPGGVLVRTQGLNLMRASRLGSASRRGSRACRLADRAEDEFRHLAASRWTETDHEQPRHRRPRPTPAVVPPSLEGGRQPLHEVEGLLGAPTQWQRVPLAGKRELAPGACRAVAEARPLVGRYDG